MLDIETRFNITRRPSRLDIAGQLVIVVFVIVYILITSEKVNRTAISLTGMAAAALILWILGPRFYSLLDR
jgi:Na+/H+ antiporter NhaD/arsenite permease-like protein